MFKKEKKMMLKNIRYQIFPYPKGSNTNYDTGSFDDKQQNSKKV
jgi:hypothetical protein